MRLAAFRRETGLPGPLGDRAEPAPPNHGRERSDDEPVEPEDDPCPAVEREDARLRAEARRPGAGGLRAEVRGDLHAGWSPPPPGVGVRSDAGLTAEPYGDSEHVRRRRPLGRTIRAPRPVDRQA